MRPLEWPSLSRRVKVRTTRKQQFLSAKLTKRLSLVLILILCTTGMTVYFLRSDFKSKAIAVVEGWTLAVFRTTGLVVNEVLVEGRARTKRQELIAALKISIGDAILPLDIQKMHARVSRLDWIASARIERRLPSTIFLSVVERTPTALWQKNGRLSLIDAKGDIILRDKVEPFASLPIVIGDQAPSLAGEMLATLSKEALLFPRIKSITLVSNRRWNVRLDGHIDIQLPEKNPDKAWAHLARVQKGHNILHKDVVAVDMRLKGQLIIRLESTKTPLRKKPGRTT